MEELTDNLIAKPKRSKGRPKKNFNPDKTYTWLDESAYKRALQDFKIWEEQYELVKTITGKDFETIEDFEANLRSQYPELDALDISQLYLVAKLDKQAIRSAYSDLKRHSKVPTDKATYTVKIPSENALEYSHYLSIVQAFTELRKSNIKINIIMLPQITNNKIVFDIRTGQLRVNSYQFTENYK